MSERNLKISLALETQVPFEELVFLEVETGIKGSGYHHTQQECFGTFYPSFKN